MTWSFGDPWVLLAAVALDLVAGDPPSRFHPVAGMGWLIAALRKRSPTYGRLGPFLAGMGILAVGLALCVGGGLLVCQLREVAFWPGVIVEAVLLKTTFSLRGLASAALEVRRALGNGDLPEARRVLAWHLVSRDTTTLDEGRVAAAAIESVAENASDGVVAPWLFYLAAGLPGALAYRFANTADAMLGYRDAEREWLGKAPARLDDLLNLVPARLTALCILLAGGRWLSGLRVWWRDAGKTASPNAGHPMAAAAGVLGVELEKVGCYRLGAGQRLPRADDIARAVRLLFAVAGLVLGMAVLSRLLG